MFTIQHHYEIRWYYLLVILKICILAIYIGIYPNPVPFGGLNEQSLFGIAGDHWLHFLFFVLLTVLLPRSFHHHPLSYSPMLLVILLFLAFASEFIQGMFPWKRFDWWDILANVIGVFIGSLVLLGLSKCARKFQTNYLYELNTNNV